MLLLNKDQIHDLHKDINMVMAHIDNRYLKISYPITFDEDSRPLTQAEQELNYKLRREILILKGKMNPKNDEEFELISMGQINIPMYGKYWLEDALQILREETHKPKKDDQKIRIKPTPKPSHGTLDLFGE